MRVVTRRTGLSAEILRVWERRYRVVTPARTQTGRRLYSDAEIERLHLLHRATLGGRTIGLVAALPTAALAELVRQDADAERTRASRGRPESVDPGRHAAGTFLREAVHAVERFDPVALGSTLHRAAVALPVLDFLENVVSALLEQVGTRWQDGSLRPMHGQLTATVTRHVLERMMVPAPGRSPKLLLATVTGQPHELGSLIAAAAAVAEGWSVTWLGASLPAADIAEAAVSLGARAVGVSLIHPSADQAVSEEIRRLRSLMPRPMTLIVGGAAMDSYAVVLDDIDAVRATGLDMLVERLRGIAAPARSRKGTPRKRGRSAGRRS
jgi:DNA-binding transcriptional MerR regulator/methanogenic corrinoid protein MtbC1